MPSMSQIKGLAFEKWLNDVLDKFVNVKMTKYQEHFDITFDKDDKHYIIECKCFEYFHTVKKQKQVGNVCIQDPQTEFLKYRSNGINGNNVVLYVVGITFNRYDIHPVVIPLDRMVRFSKRSKSKGRKFITMTRLIRQQSLLQWIEEEFGIEPYQVHYPPFHRYMIQEEEKYAQEKDKDREKD